mmetsp:Transcript_51220/g.146241  ORF Transcript_51220/g.146241 Transcript_51220/m.146241 type:complete len:1008 (+) Transcript_51220:99-3122(+)
MDSKELVEFYKAQAAAERQLRFKAEKKLEFQHMMKSSQESASQRATCIKTVDVCFVLDCTQSMEPFIQSAKTKLEEIGHLVRASMGIGASVRFAIVAYRDHDAHPFEHPEVLDFTDNVRTCRLFLASLEAKGGDDWCEDVLRGLDAATSLSWQAKTRMLFLLAQTPAHGSRFHRHGAGEEFEQGGVRLFVYDKHIHTPDQWDFADGVLHRIRHENIHVTCLEVSGSTAQMFEVFSEIYNFTDATRVFSLQVQPMTSSPESIYSAVRKASWNSIESSLASHSRDTCAQAAHGFGELVDLKIDERPIDWDGREGWMQVKVAQESFTLDSSTDIRKDPESAIVGCGEVKGQISMARRPFSKGAMRYAFAVVDHKTEGKLVAKIYAHKTQRRPDKYLGDIRTQVIAQYLAQEFNKRTKKSPLKFVEVQLMSMPDGTLLCVEPFMPGEYTKSNNNAGYVSKGADFAQAFSHFTHDFSGGKMAVVDIQGVHSNLTDPQIHSEFRCFGAGNLGNAGIDAFFVTHKCSELCKKLKLFPNPLQTPGLPEDERRPEAEPTHLCAFEFRACAREALRRNEPGPEWLGPICLDWGVLCPKQQFPMVVGVSCPCTVYMDEDAAEAERRRQATPEWYTQQLQRSFEHRLLICRQSQSDSSLAADAEALARYHSPETTDYVVEKHLARADMLKTLMFNDLHGMSKKECLRLFAEYYDDSDTTNLPSMVFERGTFNPARIPPAPRKPDAKAARKKPGLGSVEEESSEQQSEDLTWLCGGKCGRLVSRKRIQDRYHGKLPTDVFCAGCAKKARDSWRAKVCENVDCEAYIKYYAFVLDVQKQPEPKLCKECTKKATREDVTIRAEAWRMKKCQRCKAQMEFYVGAHDASRLCERCAHIGEDDADFREGEQTDWAELSAAEEIDWKKYKEDVKPAEEVNEAKPQATCSMCNETIAGQPTTLVCQTGHHTFVLCAKRGCDAALEKRGVAKCKAGGAGGKKHLDYAKGRAAKCCPECMLVLREEKTT